MAGLVRTVRSVLQGCSPAEDVKLARRFNPQVAATLEGYADEEVWSRIAVMRGSDDQEDQAENPRLAEIRKAALTSSPLSLGIEELTFGGAARTGQLANQSQPWKIASNDF